MSDKQVHTFAQKLSQHPEFASQFAVVGGSCDQLAARIAVKLRSSSGQSYIGDMEKYNSAAMMGFTVLRFSTEQVKSGLAVQQIEKMVGRNE